MHDSREVVSFCLLFFIYVVSPFIALGFSLCSFTCLLCLVCFLAYVSDQPLLVAFVLISEACGYCFPPSFVGLLYLAKVVDLSLMQAFLPSRVYTDFRAF